MKNRRKSHLADLTEQLNEATERLVKVVHRLDEFEAQDNVKHHMSTIDPDDFEPAANQHEEKPVQKRFNPEAGP